MRLGSFRLAVAAALALSLASCDGAGPEPEVPPETPPTAPAPGTLSFAPLPDGVSLFSSGPGVGARAAVAPTAYGCYFSSPNPGAPAAERYRLGKTLIDFPQDVLDEAEGRARVVALSFGSRTAFAATPRETPTLLRVARCVIPDTEGAADLVVEALAQVGDDGTAEWEGEPMEGPPAAASEEEPEARTASGSSCRMEFVRFEYCASIGYTCTDWRVDYREVWVCGPPGGGGGGPGYSDPGDGTGPGGDPCGGGPAYFPTEDQGGLGCDNNGPLPADQEDVYNELNKCKSNGQPISNSLKNEIFASNLRRVLGFQPPAVFLNPHTPGGFGVSDGIQRVTVTNAGPRPLVARFFEASLTDGYFVRNTDQGRKKANQIKGMVDILHSNRIICERPEVVCSGYPHLVIASTSNHLSLQDAGSLAEHGNLIDYAEARGVPIYHVRLSR